MMISVPRWYEFGILLPKHHWMRTFFRNNGLSLVFLLFFIITLIAQFITGQTEHNRELLEKGKDPVSAMEYFSSGHFLQATFENWESEFFQMALFVILTTSLYQKGSSESKDPDEREPVDRTPSSRKKDAPWPVKKGGIYLKVYEHSLSIAFILLFIISLLIHFYGSLKDENEQLLAEGKPLHTAAQYISDSRFWFESFQNWQSEFLAVFSIVVLSIFLRQKGSPQSKPVDAPHGKTGSE